MTEEKELPKTETNENKTSQPNLNIHDAEVNSESATPKTESAEENNISDTADTNEKEEKKSWFDKLFQSNPAKLKEQMEELSAKNEELKDKYLRLFADFDNYKKRVAREKLELIETAGKDFYLSLLPVLDDFERAIKAGEASDDATLKEGVQLVYQKLLKTLESKGVKSMESTGTDFNPDLHEAITEIAAPNEALKGKVVDTVEKGYFLGEKILRYAKVVVGK